MKIKKKGKGKTEKGCLRKFFFSLQNVWLYYGY